MRSQDFKSARPHGSTVLGGAYPHSVEEVGQEDASEGGKGMSFRVCMLAMDLRISLTMAGSGKLLLTKAPKNS